LATRRFEAMLLENLTDLDAVDQNFFKGIDQNN